MNLWVCLKCFERVRGSLDSIIKEASEHMCDVNPPIFEYLAGCHKILNDCAPKNMGLPPPPPPPLPQMVPNQPMPRKAVFSQSNKRVSAVAAIAERNKLLGTEISQAGPAPKMPNMASTPKGNTFLRVLIKINGI